MESYVPYISKKLKEAPPIYGILKPAATWNPIRINFQHIWLLVQDAWRTKSIKNKFTIWFMPTGWRPADVKEKYPIVGIQDVYNLAKYRIVVSNAFILYAIYQLLSCTALLLFMFFNFANLDYNQLLLYRIFLFISVYGYSSLMDQKKYAKWIAFFRSISGLAFLSFSGDRFGIQQYWPWVIFIIAGYFLSTILGTIYFGYMERTKVQTASFP